MGRREMVRDLPVDERHLLQRELAHVAPCVSEPGLVKVQAVLAHDPASLVRRLLRSVVVEAERARERERSDAHVRQEALPLDLDAQERVRARRRDVRAACRFEPGAEIGFASKTEGAREARRARGRSARSSSLLRPLQDELVEDRIGREASIRAASRSTSRFSNGIVCVWACVTASSVWRGAGRSSALVADSREVPV